MELLVLEQGGSTGLDMRLTDQNTRRRTSPAPQVRRRATDDSWASSASGKSRSSHYVPSEERHLAASWMEDDDGMPVIDTAAEPPVRIMLSRHPLSSPPTDDAQVKRFRRRLSAIKDIGVRVRQAFVSAIRPPTGGTVPE
ncbi:hypothetical protein LTR85_006037 [Meristemomyces frigidus]|nr:hypothetical protein LTR85_006037 [Meristemomyces frigidus]